jgi:hypothetical protein
MSLRQKFNRKQLDAGLQSDMMKARQGESRQQITNINLKRHAIGDDNEQATIDFK